MSARRGNSGRRGEATKRTVQDIGPAKYRERLSGRAAPIQVVFTPTVDITALEGNAPVDSQHSSKANQKAIRALPEGHPAEFIWTSMSDREIVELTENRIISSPDVRPEVPDGVNSLAMGFHGSKTYECATCRQNESCYGHPGRIELGEDMIRPVYLEYVMTIIQSVCRQCGHIPVDSSIYNSTTVQGSFMVAIRDATMKPIANCINCHQNPFNVIVSRTESPRYGQVIYSRLDSKINKEPGVGSRKYLMKIGTVKSILNKVNKHTLAALMIRVPTENMITRKIIVVSPIIRQSLQLDSIVEHPMTTSYRNIIRANDAYIKLPEKSRHTNQVEPLNLYCQLVGAVTFLVKGGKAGGSTSGNSLDVWIEPVNDSHLPTNANEAISVTLVFNPNKGFGGKVDPNSNLNKKFGSKKGLLINEVLSKRCQGGKAVASIKHAIPYGHVAIPRAMSLEFTVPMTVTAENYNLIMHLLIPDSYYKAGRILKIKKKNHMEVTNMSSRYTIEIGDEVHRCLMDGDLIILNRFPLIWRHSMSSYTVVLHDELTIGMHSASLGKHAADFDGDIFVVRVPQTELARKSAALMHVRFNYVAADTGSAVAGLIMDASLGAYFMTANVRVLSEAQFRDYLMRIHQDSEVVDALVERTKIRVDEVNATISGVNIEYFTSSNLFATTFPDEFAYEHEGVVIINSVIITGVLQKAQLDSGPYSIVRILEANHEHEDVANYLTYSNWLTIEWMNDRGSTIGTRDLYLGDDDFVSSVKKLQQESIRKYEVMMLQGAKNNESAVDTEQKAWKILDSTQGKIAKMFIDYCKKNGATGPGNTLYHLINSGKISKEIATQLVGSVGSLTYFNQHCPETEGRCTVYGVRRRPGDIRDPRELGYITSSYSEGLTPEEVFTGLWASMGGAVSTNCSTASFGHTYNLLNAVLTSMFVKYGMVTQDIGAITRLIMSCTDLRGINTEDAIKDSRGEFGIGSLGLLADRVNFKYATVAENPSDVEF